jgi:pimeloyl-ACP methyl ester carboxylesterase
MLGGALDQRPLFSVITSKAHELGASQLVLIGYSGGGALAVLIAERLEDVTAVITLAANLDIEAWANHHHYLPLAQSLNPARSLRAHPWPEFHFSGLKDTVVPAATTDRYFQRYPAARRLAIEAADHVCCWEAQWPALLARVQRELE